MKKASIYLVILFSLLCLLYQSDAGIIIGDYYDADYCSSITWPDLSSPEFTLDFDHTDDGKKSCGTNQETGTLSGATIVAQPVTSPTGTSQGNCLLADATSDIITFDNSGSYFASASGILSALINMNNSGEEYHPVYISHDSNNRINIQISAAGAVYCAGRGSGNGEVLTPLLVDIKPGYNGDWVQVQCRWRADRCTVAPCGDAGEDEICGRWRADGDQDQAWDAAFSAWSCDTDTDDYTPFSSEPDTDDLDFGLASGTYSTDLYIDDIEIESSVASW